jgi:Fanconi anemia group I protein
MQQNIVDRVTACASLPTEGSLPESPECASLLITTCSENSDLVVSMSSLVSNLLAAKLPENVEISIIETSINVLSRGILPNKPASDLVSTLNSCCDMLCPRSLVRALNLIVDSVSEQPSLEFDRDFKVLELFSKFLATAGALSSVDIVQNRSDPIANQTYDSGAQLKETYIMGLCDLNKVWPIGAIVPLSQQLREIVVSDDASRCIVKKLLKQFPNVLPNELPSFTYQLLLFPSNQSRSLIIRGILKHFNALDATLSKTRAAQGTLLLHFNFAAKQDCAIGNGLIQVVCSTLGAMSLFDAALLLSLSRIPRYQKKVFDLFKTVCELHFQGHNRRHLSGFICEVQGLPVIPNVSNMLCDACRIAAQYWDSVLPSLLSLSFSFMQFRSNKRGHAVEEGGTLPVASSLADVGCAMLMTLWNQCEASRREILSEIVMRIESKSGTRAFLLLLRDMMISASTTLSRDCIPKLKELIEYICFLSGSDASFLIRSLSPAVFIHSELLDHTILVLRKTMFHRDISIRTAALKGMLSLLICSNSHNPDEFSVCSQSAVGSRDNGRFVLDIFALLQRGCTQQASIRSLLYDGLVELCSSSPCFIAPSIELLSVQMQKIRKDVAIRGSPFHHENCIDRDGAVIEPIGHFLKSCSSISLLAHRAGISNDLTPALHAIAQALGGCELEDFDCGISLPHSPFVIAMGGWIIAACEASIDFVSLEWSFAEQLPEALREFERGALSLFALLRRAQDFVRDRVAKMGDKKAKSSKEAEKENGTDASISKGCDDRKDRDEDCFMSAACLHAIFRALTLPDPECMSLKQSMPFITHCLISTQKLAKPEFLENNIIFEIVQAVPSMLHYIRKICGLPNCISTVLAGGGGTNSKKAQIYKPISLVACDAVAAIVKSAISNLDQSSMEEACVSLKFSQASGLLKAGHKASATEALVHAIHLLLEESVAKEDWHCSATLISLTCKLSMYVPPLRRRILSKWPLSILDKGDGLAISQILSKPLFEYLLQLSSFEKDLKMLHIVSTDVKTVIGDLAEADASHGPSQASPRIRFPIVDALNHGAIITCVCENVKGALLEVEWCIVHSSKAYNLLVSEDDQELLADHPDVADADNLQLEGACIARMSAIIEVVNTLNRCSIEGIAAETVMTATESMFKTLFVLVRKVTSNGKLPGSDFDHLIEKLGSSVYKSMYDFIYNMVKCQESTASKAKINKEARIIPNLVFQVERVEGLLIKAAKATKQDFLRHLRRGTSRDFRIDIGKLMESDDGTPATNRYVCIVSLIR